MISGIREKPPTWGIHYDVRLSLIMGDVFTALKVHLLNKRPINEDHRWHLGRAAIYLNPERPPLGKIGRTERLISSTSLLIDGREAFGVPASEPYDTVQILLERSSLICAALAEGKSVDIAEIEFVKTAALGMKHIAERRLCESTDSDY